MARNLPLGTPQIFSSSHYLGSGPRGIEKEVSPCGKSLASWPYSTLSTYPDPRLREVSAKVTAFDKDLKTLLDNMAETMYAAPGIGLAAVQVGVMLQVAVVDVSRKGTERFDIVKSRDNSF